MSRFTGSIGDDKPGIWLQALNGFLHGIGTNQPAWERELALFFGANMPATRSHVNYAIARLPEHLRMPAARACEAALRLFVPEQPSDSWERCNMIDKVLEALQADDE
jgi:hypothetical protein